MSLLPSCPSCGQSVLDDDAVECPFCGAAMKGGKPGAKPAAPTNKPAAPAKKAEPKKAAADDDNPFGGGNSMNTRKAIALLAKPGKGKLHRILCPMCETPGFWSKDAVGQEVKCANPECLMPIFTAPHPEGEAPAVEAPKPTKATASAADVTKPAKKKSALIPVSVGIVLVGGGLLAWSQMAGSNAKQQANDLNKAWTPPANSTPVASADPATTEPGATPDPAADPAADPNKTAAPTTTSKTPALPSNDELRAEGLKRIVEFAADPDRNKRKEQCRRLTAETMALMSDLNAVNEQLKQFDLVGGDQIRYYHAGPLALAAWNRMAANDVAKAKDIVARASEFANQLPPTGGYPLEAAIEMASLYLALDQADEAVKLMSSRKNEPELEGQVDACLRAERTGRFNLEEAAVARSISTRSLPSATLAFNLVMRGQAAKAMAWAKTATEPPVLADTLAGMAEGLIASGGSLDAVNGEINKLAPGFKARALARIAIAHHGAGQADQAKAAVAQALESANAVANVTVPEMPDMKGIYNLQLSDMTARVEDAMSIAEIAHAQALIGDRDAVWGTLLKAVNVARATAPLATAATGPLNEIKSAGNSAITSKIKTLLKLKGDDEARLAFNQYRKNATALAENSANRFTLVGHLLELACEWGFVDQVWTEVQARGSSTDAATAEPWFDSQVPSVCEAYYRAAGQTEKSTAVEQAVGADRLKEKVAHRTRFRLAALKAADGSGKDAGAAEVARLMKDFLKVGKAGGDKPWQEETLGRIASQMVAKGNVTAGFALASAVEDPFTRDTLFELVAAQATKKGDIATVRDYALNNRSVAPPDRVAVLRGLIVNLPK